MQETPRKQIYEQKRKEKSEKRQQEQQEVKKKRLFTLLAIAVPVIIVGALFVVGINNKGGTNLPDVGEVFLDQGREHIPEGSKHPAYNSLPPTSGWHYDTPVDWGVYKEEIPQERLVHNLEHGGIVIQYKPSLDVAVLKQLEDLKNSDFECKLVVAPYSGLDKNIAVTAWHRLYKNDTYEEQNLKTFIQKYRNLAPEFVPCDVKASKMPTG